MGGYALIFLGDDRIVQFDRIANVRRKSRSAVIRKAIGRLIEARAPAFDDQVRRNAVIDAAFCILKGRIEFGDAVQSQ